MTTKTIVPKTRKPKEFYRLEDRRSNPPNPPWFEDFWTYEAALEYVKANNFSEETHVLYRCTRRRGSGELQMGFIEHQGRTIGMVVQRPGDDSQIATIGRMANVEKAETA
jgi:hypothetical protein